MVYGALNQRIPVADGRERARKRIVRGCVWFTGAKDQNVRVGRACGGCQRIGLVQVLVIESTTPLAYGARMRDWSEREVQSW